MVKSGPLFFSLLLFSACAGGPVSSPAASSANADASEQHFFYSMPAGNGLVFIGAAGKRSNSNDTLQFALEDAAQRVAIFYHIFGEYAIENNVGSGAFDYTYDVNKTLYYDKEGAAQYIDALQYDIDTDTVEIDNAFFIRTTYPSALPFPVNYRPKYSGKNNKPDWIDNPPLKLDGYYAGVGFSSRYSSMADTYTNSCHNAIFSIIRSINADVQNNSLLYQNTGNLFGYKTSNENIVYSYGTLNGFYVLDTWIDPQSKTIWTLAIARKE